MLYQSQLSKDMTNLSDTLYVTHWQGYRLTNAVSVTNDHGYDYLIRYLFLSQMGRDVTRLSNTLSVTNDQGYD
jgi:hypothetical protein